jgi:hypothetical protein
LRALLRHTFFLVSSFFLFLSIFLTMMCHSNTNVKEIPAIPTLTDPSQNPYYVHPNESATATLVTPPLDGKSYHAWSRSLMKVVIVMNKLCFLDGSCPMPDLLDPTYEPCL